MSHFVEELEKEIRKQEKSNNQELQLVGKPFQKIQLETARLLQTFNSITIFKIIDCDLRTLQNFPLLPNLAELWLPNNKLQDSFKHLQGLNRLKYLDISNNLIVRSSSLYPLKQFRQLVVCVNNNPFTRREQQWKDVLKGYKLTVEERPKSQPPLVKCNSGTGALKLQRDFDDRKLKPIKRKDSGERPLHRPIQALLAMAQNLQHFNSQMDSELLSGGARPPPPSYTRFRREDLRGLSLEDLMSRQLVPGDNTNSTYGNSLPHQILSPTDSRELALERQLFFQQGFQPDFGLIEDQLDEY